MKKVCGFLGVLLVAGLLVMPGAANAEMYVEAYLGANFADNTSTAGSVTVGGARYNYTGGNGLNINPAVQAGLKFGTWFVPTGFLGYNYPDWMKYFGFYTDLSFHRLDTRRERIGTFPVIGGIDVSSEGTAFTWAFMFAARVGFVKDSEVPFGRVQPYVAVGPAILFATQEPKVTAPAIGAGVAFGSASSAAIALAVEAGVRFMALKNVSIDASFKYRYSEPSFTYSNLAGFQNSLTWSPTYNLFSFQLGAAYHF